MNLGREYNAIVIGSGLSGSTLTYRLAQHGLPVLVIDKGDFLLQPLLGPNDPIGLHVNSFDPKSTFVGTDKILWRCNVPVPRNGLPGHAA